MSTIRDGNTIGEIATNRTNSNGFKGTIKSQKIFKDLRGGRENQIDEEDDDDDEESAGFDQSSSIYEIHKILSSDQYTIGKSVSDYIESFHLQYKNLQESAELLPQPLEGI
jgi:hypothetical protein